MIEKPEQDADLQLLDQRLRDRHISLHIYDLGSGWENRYAVEILHGRREGVASDGFNDVAAEVVAKTGGAIFNDFGRDGFDAGFPTDEARTNFLRTFAAAARTLPEGGINGIHRTPIGIKLGAFGP